MVARRSATESAAVRDICRAIAIGEEPTLAAGDALVLRIVSMLTKMVVRTAPRA